MDNPAEMTVAETQPSDGVVPVEAQEGTSQLSDKVLEEVTIGDFDRDDMDLGQYSSFRLPPVMRQEGVAINAWAMWFGTQKAALRAAENLATVRNNGAASVLRKYRRAPPLAFYTVVVSNPSVSTYFLPFLREELLGTTEPEYRVLPNLPAVLRDSYADFQMIMDTGTANDRARKIEEFWPFTKDLHDEGAFVPCFSPLLIAAGYLRTRLESEEKISSSDRLRLVLTICMLLRTLPPRLAGLVALHAPSFKEAYSHDYKVFGLTLETFDPTRSFWEQAPDGSMRDTARYLLIISKQKGSQYGEEFDILQYLERRMVMLDGLPRQLDKCYQGFSAKAKTRYDRLRESIRQYSEALEVKVEAKSFPADLVGRPVPFERIQDLGKAHMNLCHLITEEFKAGSIEHIVDEASLRMSKVTQVHERISQLNKTPSVTSMMEIARLAEEARQEILLNRDWFFEQVSEAKGYVMCWESFYEAQGKLVETPTPKGHSRGEKLSQSVPRAAEGEGLQAIRKERDEALQKAEHLRAELRDTKGELHRAQTQLEGFTGNKPREVPAIGMSSDLALRIATRSNLSPLDVLQFFASVAADRLVVLDSAYRSVEPYKSSFDGTQRFLELLSKLVYPYFEQLQKGTPDTQARNVFGGKAYSAKESDSTLSDARMRGMREFTYQGEKRLFQRHLKIGSGTGYSGMRVYFDIIDGKVVVAYCGPHLDVQRTN